jgi:7-cyano-7-deazaguanine synthase
MLKKYKAVVVFSGGQDSTTCLGLAIHEFGADRVACISFNYGQKHAIELECAQAICDKWGVSLKNVNVDMLAGMVTSALTSNGDTTQPHAYKKDLPASFVPNRNALFLVLAHAYAQELGADLIYTGVCETDYSGYPDCRQQFITSLQESLNIGYETDIIVLTPLMSLNKAETFALADKVNFLPTVIEMSHTCYDGDHTTRHDWGYGCGTCPSCLLRAKGFIEFSVDQELS